MGGIKYSLYIFFVASVTKRNKVSKAFRYFLFLHIVLKIGKTDHQQYHCTNKPTLAKVNFKAHIIKTGQIDANIIFSAVECYILYTVECL